MSIGNLKKSLFFSAPWVWWAAILRFRSRQIGVRRRFRKNNVGKHSYVDPTVQIFGWQNVSIGDNTTVSEDTWLNVNSRAGSCDDLIIGNHCHIGRRNYFSTGGLIHVKDFSFTGIDCHFLGCGHDIDFPLRPYIATGLTPGAVIEVGVNCWLTTSVTVLQGVRIGHGSIIGARSVVTNDVPPFSIAVGSPAKVIKRFDFGSQSWIGMAKWDEELSELMPAESAYLEQLLESPTFLPGLQSASSRFGWLRRKK